MVLLIIPIEEFISPGPNEVGFDHSFIMADTQDRVPTVYIENGYVVNLEPMIQLKSVSRVMIDGLPSGLKNPELLSMIGTTVIMHQ